MAIYVVGGAVRDGLLGLPVHDRDWVVVGSTPEAMAAQGFVPVGKDFPVFLHPKTREEYALARTERKTARGYKGFAVQASPEVTLEEDLARRDLTINAMAIPQALAHAPATQWSGHIVDPWGGQHDLAHQRLHHVTAAFAEDPVRILRVARFAARLPQFSVAPDTMTLMQDMVHRGEVQHLVPERVWQELARGLMTDHPGRMLEVLRDCGALPVLLPELTLSPGTLDALGHCAQAQAPLPVRWACLMNSCSDPGAVGQRLRVPNDCQQLAQVLAREHPRLLASDGLDAAALLQLLIRCDALRQPERFAMLLQASQAWAASPSDTCALARLPVALEAAQSVATAAVAAQAAREGLHGPQVGARIDAARTAAIAARL